MVTNGNIAGQTVAEQSASCDASDRRVHLFGGRVRTGSGAEFVIAAACVGLAALVVWQSGARGFLPFFYNWGELYGRGLIDGLEWRSHRFNYL